MSLRVWPVWPRRFVKQVDDKLTVISTNVKNSNTEMIVLRQGVDTLLEHFGLPPCSGTGDGSGESAASVAAPEESDAGAVAAAAEQGRAHGAQAAAALTPRLSEGALRRMTRASGASAFATTFAPHSLAARGRAANECKLGGCFHWFRVLIYTHAPWDVRVWMSTRNCVTAAH